MPSVARCCMSSPVRPDMVTAGEIHQPPLHGYLGSTLLSGALHPSLANTASPLHPHVMTEDRELMSMLAEALNDFDAPVGSSNFEHGARDSGSSASSLFPFHAFTASSHGMTDPATLRLLADALDAFDEPGCCGGACVHVALGVELSQASSQYPCVSSSLDPSSTLLYPTVDSKSGPLVTGTQSAPHAAQCGRADWGGSPNTQPQHSSKQLAARRRLQHTGAHSTQTLTARRRLQHSDSSATANSACSSSPLRAVCSSTRDSSTRDSTTRDEAFPLQL